MAVSLAEAVELTADKKSPPKSEIESKYHLVYNRFRMLVLVSGYAHTRQAKILLHRGGNRTRAIFDLLVQCSVNC